MNRCRHCLCKYSGPNRGYHHERCRDIDAVFLTSGAPIHPNEREDIKAALAAWEKWEGDYQLATALGRDSGPAKETATAAPAGVAAKRVATPIGSKEVDDAVHLATDKEGA